MEELSLDRSELRRMQREQERERRRVRDRQRRQSMTVEQRERHLARRRRNYQLRRLRAENAKAGDFPSHVQQISNEHEAAASGGNNDVWQVTQLEKTTAERLQHSECLEAVVSRSANFPKRLRLSHIRRLARSLNNLGGEVIGNHQIVAQVVPKGDASNASCFRIGDFESGRLPNGRRFSCVKRLARSINTSTNEASVNGPKVEQNLSVEEIRVISDDKPKFGQTIDVSGELEGADVDEFLVDVPHEMLVSRFRIKHTNVRT